MFIYNTTFNIEKTIENESLEWLRTRYIPYATQSDELKSARLSLIMSNGDENTRNYSLQFEFESIDNLEVWYHKYGAELLHEMETKFGQKMIGFATILSVLDL